MKFFILLLLCLTCADAISAEVQPLKLPAIKCKEVPVIDGDIADPAWKQASFISNLVEFRPLIGDKEKENERTELYLMYNDEGIYFAGRCFESSPEMISKELKGRDGFGTNDYIGIIFDTYSDNINGFEYFVTPLGEQWDAKMSPGNNSNNGGEDFGWNAVWNSAAKMHEKGWDFEMFIPFSAIRFGKDEKQDWGLNITRRRRKTEEQFTWNPIDPTKNGFLPQEGYWTGLRDIKPPVRLQFSPYMSVYANHFPNGSKEISDWSGQVNGGMDLKFGISQSYTLDAILIPDFGQVQSDNRVLNLSPFEVKFNENRNFFSEGTELFNKGGLFYSRRIGGSPLHYYRPGENLHAGEEITRNPSETKLINATKISGRSQSGLGIGLLNAITKPSYAIIERIDSEGSRKELTSPLTNYNVLVLDQTMKNNSSVTFFNSNVMRSGGEYDSNVSAFLFDQNDKKNTWNLNGKIAISKYWMDEEVTKPGISGSLGIGKISGRFTFRLFNEYSDNRYSHNDLGYFTNNNFINNNLYMSYRIIKPKGWYNRINFNFNTGISHLAQKIGNIDKTYQNAYTNFNINTQTKKLYFFGLFTGYNPSRNDFYEPRTIGQFLYRGPRANLGMWMESNSAKKLSFYTEIFGAKFINFYNGKITELSFGPRYRLSSKISVGLNLNIEKSINNIGFASTISDGTTIIGKRDIKTFSNIFDAKYSFSNKMWITMRARHYQSTVKYEDFYSLRPDGRLNPNTTFNENRNTNVNFFNVDMVYTWQFAPGSFFNLVWKNNTFTEKDKSDTAYFLNLKEVLKSDQNNNLSLKVIYFIDYLRLRAITK